MRDVMLVHPVLVKALQKANASQRLRQEREVVWAAVAGENGGSQLQYAAPELRNDKDIVLMAVSKQVLGCSQLTLSLYFVRLAPPPPPTKPNSHAPHANPQTCVR
jgi:hypothetical protein